MKLSPKFIVFEQSSGKMVSYVPTENVARIAISLDTKLDYLNIDEEFDYNLRSNPEWEFLIPEVKF